MKTPEFTAGNMENMVVARIASVLAATEMVTPYMNVSDYNMLPEHIAIHAVETAKANGNLGFLAKAVGLQ